MQKPYMVNFHEISSTVKKQQGYEGLMFCSDSFETLSWISVMCKSASKPMPGLKAKPNVQW